MQAFLVAFNTGDPARWHDFIYSEHHLPDAGWERFYGMMYQDTMGLTPFQVEAAEEHSITVLMQKRVGSGWFRLTLTVQPAPPHLILSFRPGGAGRPAGLPPQPPISEGEMILETRMYAAELAAADRFSGTVLIARNGQVLLHKAWGLASRGYGVPNRPDTRFNLGSMNKMFTAVATLQLVQAGRLALTDPIAQHLPEYPRPAAEQITIHHLLSHQSGLGSYWNEQFEQSKQRLRTVADFLPLFQAEPIAFEPGARFQYSNAGFIVLGAVIEAVTGMSYFDYVRTHIYAPAGMADTDCYEVDEEQPNVATGYTHTDWQGRFYPDRWFTNILRHVVQGGPAGGGFATAPDLLRFAGALQDGRLLAPALTDLLWEQKRPDTEYGYGFATERCGSTRVVGHAGGFPGINANLDMFLDLGYTVVVMANCDAAALWIRDRVRELISRVRP